MAASSPPLATAGQPSQPTVLPIAANQPFNAAPTPAPAADTFITPTPAGVPIEESPTGSAVASPAAAGTVGNGSATSSYDTDVVEGEWILGAIVAGVIVWLVTLLLVWLDMRREKGKILALARLHRAGADHRVHHLFDRHPNEIFQGRHPVDFTNGEGTGIRVSRREQQPHHDQARHGGFRHSKRERHSQRRFARPRERRTHRAFGQGIPRPVPRGRDALSAA